MLSIEPRQFTISLTYTVNIDESVLQKPVQQFEENQEGNFWEQHHSEMLQRLLHQLIQNPQELSNIILQNIAGELDNLESADWEDLLLNKNHCTHPRYFDGDDLLPTIHRLNEADQCYWMNIYQNRNPSPEEIEQIQQESINLPPGCIISISDWFLESTIGLFESVQVELSNCDVKETTQKTSSSPRHHSNRSTKRKKKKR